MTMSTAAKRDELELAKQYRDFAKMTHARTVRERRELQREQGDILKLLDDLKERVERKSKEIEETTIHVPNQPQLLARFAKITDISWHRLD